MPSITTEYILENTRLIHAISFNPDGYLVMAGDNEGSLRIWSLPNRKLVQIIDDVAIHGAITACIWASYDEGNGELVDCIVLGSASGHIHVFKREITGTEFSFITSVNGHYGAVRDLSFHKEKCLLASAGSGFPQLWAFNHQSMMQLESPRPDGPLGYICTSVNFTVDGNLLVSYAGSHTIHVYSTAPFAQLNVRSLRSRIGHAAIHAESLYVSVIGQSPEMYSMRSFALTKSFPKRQTEEYIMQLAIVNKGQWLVVGGEKGLISVYATATASLEHTLIYEKRSILASKGNRGRVQVVAALDCPRTGKCLVASASTDSSNPGAIKIWTLEGNSKSKKWICWARAPSRLTLVFLLVAIPFLSSIALTIYCMVHHPAAAQRAFSSLLDWTSGASISSPTVVIDSAAFTSSLTSDNLFALETGTIDRGLVLTAKDVSLTSANSVPTTSELKSVSAISRKAGGLRIKFAKGSLLPTPTSSVGNPSITEAGDSTQNPEALD